METEPREEARTGPLGGAPGPGGVLERDYIRAGEQGKEAEATLRWGWEEAACLGEMLRPV